MSTLTSILVDIDAVAPDHPALAEAVDLAARSGARLKIVDVLPLVPSSASGFVTFDLENEIMMRIKNSA
jgi:hypothetical protein